MSDENQNGKSKKNIIYIVVGAIFVLIVGAFLSAWALGLGCFGSGKLKMNYDSFVREKNPNVKGGFMNIAIHKTDSLTEEEIKKLTKEKLDNLKKNIKKTSVEFTNFKDCCIVLAIAHYLKDNLDLTRKLAAIKLTDDEKKESSVKVLFVELSSHIMLVDDKVKVSLKEYQDFFKNIKIVKDNDGLKKLDAKTEKLVRCNKEYEVIKGELYVSEQFQRENLDGFFNNQDKLKAIFK